jgi:membrane associated rhomboid family serine protease
MFRYITHMPAAVVLGFWIVLQVFSQIGAPAGKASGVAYMAHIGGFIAGAALVFLFGRGGAVKKASIHF